MSRVYATAPRAEGCTCTTNGIWYPTPWVQLVLVDLGRMEPLSYQYICLRCAGKR